MFFEKFLNRVPEGASGVKKILQKTLILAFEENSALSRKNETKIVKITHSAAEGAQGATNVG